jgi:hypothetical protein
METKRCPSCFCFLLLVAELARSTTARGVLYWRMHCILKSMQRIELLILSEKRQNIVDTAFAPRFWLLVVSERLNLETAAPQARPKCSVWLVPALCSSVLRCAALSEFWCSRAVRQIKFRTASAWLDSDIAVDSSERGRARGVRGRVWRPGCARVHAVGWLVGWVG